MQDHRTQGIYPIDTLMGGLDQVTCAYLIDAQEPLLVETGPATSAAALATGLKASGIGPADLAHVVLTHIHLDHAGGAGVLAEAFPKATFWIHPGAAPHLADPTRLIASAARIYGDDGLRDLFGLPVPVPADRITCPTANAAIDLGNRTVQIFPTPGHASSHVAIQDVQTGIVFTGDAVGVHLPGPDILRPAAPPPEFDLDLALESIETIRSRATGSLMFAHFGPTEDVDETCSRAVETLRSWSAIAERGVAHGDVPDTIAKSLSDHEQLPEAPLQPSDLQRLELMGSHRLNALGLERYWRKQRSD